MESSVPEFKREVSKGPADRVKVDGDEAIISEGPYIVELYKNILSRQARKEHEERGAISVWKRNENGGYDSCANNVFETLPDAKDEYRVILVSNNRMSAIETFINRFET